MWNYMYTKISGGVLINVTLQVEMPHIPSRGGRRWLLKDIYMTSRGGLNQSLQLGTEFQVCPDLVQYFWKIGPDLVWILFLSL